MVVGSVNYPSPVTVNGFSCRNCSEVDLATKHIDPLHPQSGPFDRNAATDPTRQATDPVKIAAVKAKALAKSEEVVGYSPAGLRTAAPASGSVFSLSA